MQKMLRLIVLIVVLNFISPTCCQDIEYAYDPSLYKAFHKALINDTTNLIQLQSLLYPADRNSRTANTITISHCDFTVKKFRHRDTVNLGTFTNCSKACSHYNGLYCYGPSLDWGINFTLSSDPAAKSQALLVDHITLLQENLYWVDFSTFSILNFLTGSAVDTTLYNPLPYSEIKTKISIVLSIDELDTMPTYYEVQKTLKLFLSWVS